MSNRSTRKSFIEYELPIKDLEQVQGGRLPITTLALGEEGGVTTKAVGEEGGVVTTMAVGEEGGPPVTTMAVGEEGCS